MEDWTDNATLMMENSTNTTTESTDYPKTLSLIVIFVVSLLGNVCTIAILASFKQRRLPDILVIGLACTDLIATFIPVPMSLYSYITLLQFEEDSFSCQFYGTVAQFTRYASVLIVTVIALERYFAVNQPFAYRKHASPWKITIILLICWLTALILALVPVLDRSTSVLSHDGFCLFDFASNYAISILVYAGIQYCVVLVCFILVTGKLLRVYRRRKRLQVQGKYNQRSQAQEREHEITFSRPRLTSRISDLGIALRKAGPILTEKFQLGVEAQFARMMFAVVALFYVSWSTLVALMVVAQARGQEGQSGTESVALFWGIRLSVISVAVNPFIYGLLATQYRQAYTYIFRRILSSCFPSCIKPPETNVFVTSRTAGGELQGGRREDRRKRHYGSRSNGSMNGSVFSRRTGLPLLTHTTHISLDVLPQLEEESYLGHEEAVHEHSTYLPSTGELSSTVIIPHQAREHYVQDEQQEVTLKNQGRAWSENHLTDSGQHGQAAEPLNSGSLNPLAVVADIKGESVVTDLIQPKKHFPPLETVDPDDLNPGKVFENPLYDKKKASLSRTGQISMMETGKRYKLKAKYSMPRQNPTSTAKPFTQKMKSYPLSFFRGSSKCNTLETDGTDRVTCIDDPLESTNPVTRFAMWKGTRASARTYNEVKRKETVPYRITASRSFVEDLGSRGAAQEEGEISMAAKYQLSVSPTLPSTIATSPIPSPTHLSPPSKSTSLDTSTPLTTLPPSTQSTTGSRIEHSTPPPVPTIMTTPKHVKYPTSVTASLQQQTPVKELCKRFESVPASFTITLTQATTTADTQLGTPITDVLFL